MKKKCIKSIMAGVLIAMVLCSNSYGEEIENQNYHKEKALKYKDKEVRMLRSEAQLTAVDNKIQNKYLDVIFGSNSKFQIRTKIGDPNNPNDDNKILMYEMRTSYTTVKIEDKVSKYFENCEITKAPQINDGAIESECRYGNIAVKQIIEFAENSSTQRKDTVAIKYQVTNEGTEKSSFGLRIMMDTMLGDNDGAPFRVPGTGNVIKEVEFTGDEIPQYWQGFDNLENPTVISQGTLYDNTSIRPDRFVLAYWRYLSNSQWEYNVDNQRELTGDSAVAMYWNPEELYPGQTRTYVTYYGISNFQAGEEGDFSINLTGPTRLKTNTDEYTPNPFTVTLYIANRKDEDIENVQAEIDLPEELSLFSDSKSEINIGDLKAGEEKQISWILYAADQLKDKTLNYSIKVKGNNDKVSEIEGEIFVPMSLKKIDVEIPEITGYELKRECGIEYEQESSDNKRIDMPEIMNIDVQCEDTEKGIYNLKVNNYSVDDEGDAFFFWKTEDGYFIEAGEDYRSVKFIANPGTMGKKLNIRAYIGDGLGNTASELAVVDGVEGMNDEIELVLRDQPENLNGWDTYYIQYDAKVEGKGGTSAVMYYSLDDGEWIEIASGVIDKNIYQWIVPNERASNARIKVVAQNGREYKEIVSDEFIINPKCYIHGMVKNLNGDGIKNVTVKIGDKAVLTDSSGYYIIKNLEAGEHVITVESDEEEFLRREYTLKLDYYNPYWYKVFRSKR